MLAKRLLVVIFLVPIGAFFVAVGGWWFNILIAVFLGLAVWEYGRIFRSGGFNPSQIFLVGGVVLIVLFRSRYGFAFSDVLLAAIILTVMAASFIAYQRGQDSSAVDFGVTLGGILYIGWLGAYLVSLRALPDGKWWVLLVIPAIGLADAAAYHFGSKYGRHKVAPRVSPGKSWEGYLAGIAAGSLGATALAALFQLDAPALHPIYGTALGLLVSVVAPLGDLGESMIKRQFGVKDSSNILPGHGGIFDRIDSWLWAATIGYYFILLLTQ